MRINSLTENKVSRSSLQGRLHVLGGYSSAGDAGLATVEVLDAKTMTWRSLLASVASCASVASVASVANVASVASVASVVNVASVASVARAGHFWYFLILSITKNYFLHFLSSSFDWEWAISIGLVQKWLLT